MYVNKFTSPPAVEWNGIKLFTYVLYIDPIFLFKIKLFIYISYKLPSNQEVYQESEVHIWACMTSSRETLGQNVDASVPLSDSDMRLCWRCMVLKSNTTRKPKALHGHNTRCNFHDRVKKLPNTRMVQNMGTCTIVVMDCRTNFTRWEGIRMPKDPLPEKGEPTLTNIK